jgi:hypothetical protein
MMQAGKNDPIGDIEMELARRKSPFVRERFRVPAFPQISPSAGFLLCATGALLLASGRPASSFLVGISGALVLVLSACGFSPLDWLGPKERRSVLVVPGTPSGESRKALFLAIPVCCRLTSTGLFSRETALRRTFSVLGVLLSLALPVFSGAAALLYLSAPPAAGALAGAVLCLLGAGEWASGKNPAPERNVAAGWVGRSARSTEPAERPYILVYSGDIAEVKFFLAKYRRHVFRGHGVFAEFAEGGCGPPAVSAREGFLVHCAVDHALFSMVRAAGDACGASKPLTASLGFTTGGRIAMSRGFKAVTIFRLEAPPDGEACLPDGQALAWLEGIASAPNDLTVDVKGV